MYRKYAMVVVVALVLGAVLVPARAEPARWNKTFGGTSTDRAYSVQQTSDGGYIIAGKTYSYGAGSADVWLIKTDRNGNKTWDKTFGGTTSDGRYYVQQT